MAHIIKDKPDSTALKSVIMRGDEVVSEEVLPQYGTATIIVKGGHVNFHNVTHEKKVE